ncbi:peptidoglycan DD-metalloendopeptidase family protein [Methylomicrobium sp. Wu6]|uniref:murein hydrolase activator EnvC family protein n=1 Tax=Methylomicrobium sp. Wu6 TaxID=3107928 RepID=UPI002DD66247|nr:peptidoglycan DD-metalloendopeptidase family protein [Methylomicrobium sp. Wu6]MEC4749710.1 peptidoglycan DD-metalloendopeptidase family protein [Methylomicrobium sp. Wu6]
MRTRIVACIVLGMLAKECVAEEVTLKGDLGVVQSSIAAVKKKIQAMLLQKDAVAEQLADIENRYGESAATLKRLQDDILQNRSQMKLIRQDIVLQKDEIALHNKALAAQLRADFVMSRTGKLKLILNHQDLAKANRMVVYHDYLRRQRLKKLVVMQKSVAGLAELENRQREEAMLMERDVEKNRIEQSALELLRNERNKLLAEIEQDYSSGEQQLNRLKESENELKTLIDTQAKWENPPVDGQEPETVGMNVQSQSEEQGAPSGAGKPASADFERLKGQLPWPVSGKSAANGMQSLWDGILIDAPEGTEVRAVARGKVVYSQWLSGYGLLMILDHGNGFMTLYGFNQSLYKRVDEWVDAGDVVAGAGQSGGRSQSGLYFGIRKNGKPVDPLAWYPG